MKILISLLNFRPGQIGGAETYIRELLAGLREAANGDELVLLAHQDNCDAIPADAFTVEALPYRNRTILQARCLEAFTPYRAKYAERAIERIAPDVVLFPQQSMFPKRVGVPCVLTVVDLLHLSHPRALPWFDRAFRAAIYGRSLARCERVIAISEFTRRSLIDQANIAPEKVVTVPLGYREQEVAILSPDRLHPVSYFYYPAATHPHKNHATLLRTMAALKNQGKLRHHLVLSGIQTPHWQQLQRQIAKLGLQSDVHHLGYVSYADVRRMYRDADAVLFPSSHEGFGLPVLEAVAANKKVIVSRLPVFEELGVPERFRIDYSDPDALSAALKSPGPTILEREPITWRECAARTLKVLRTTALSEGRSWASETSDAGRFEDRSRTIGRSSDPASDRLPK